MQRDSTPRISLVMATLMVMVTLLIPSLSRHAARSTHAYSPTAVAPIDFAAEINRAVGYGLDIVSADFTNDGQADVAAIGQRLPPPDRYSQVTVLPGLGDGRLGEAIVTDIIRADYKTDTGFLVRLDAGDLDNDGNTDLVVTGHDPRLFLLYGAGDGTFPISSTYEIGYRSSLAPPLIEDLNGDQRPDLVILDDGVEVMLNEGARNFSGPTSYAPDYRPSSITSGNLNGDEHPDLVLETTDAASRPTLLLLVGTGDGGFTLGPVYDLSSSTFRLFSSDLNGDGLTDIVLVSGGPDGTIEVRFADGAGGLTAPPSYETNAGWWTDAALHDINGDRRPDLLFSSWNGNGLAVRPGAGDGRFGKPILSVTAGSLSDFVVSDLDTDAVPDVVGLDYKGTTLVLLHGRGDGTFRETPRLATGAQQLAPTLATGDFNGDQLLDLITADSGDNALLLSRSNGAGTFAPATRLPMPGEPRQIAVANINSDSFLDLATANVANSTVGLLFGDGDGTFPATTTLTLAAAPRALALDDIDGDGATDLAVGRADRQVAIFLGSGDGTFTLATTYQSATEPDRLTLMDLNSDQHIDLVISSTADSISVLAGNGDGSFQAAEDYDIGSSPTTLTPADFNNDGRKELLIGTSGYGYETFKYERTFRLLTTSADGAIYAPRTYRIAPYTVGMAVGDLNGDGRDDLVAPNQQYLAADLFLSGADGSLQPGGSYPLDGYPEAAIVARLNGDSSPDIAIAKMDKTLSLLFGAGDGTFPLSTTVQITDQDRVNVGHLASADLNTDGNSDLVISLYSSSTAFIQVLLGAGDGTFPNTLRIDLSSPGYAHIALGDINRDGSLDIVTAEDTQAISILPGRGDGSFEAPLQVSLPNYANRVALADLDGDGSQDIVASTPPAPYYPALENQIIVLHGNGDGSFTNPASYDLRRFPRSSAEPPKNQELQIGDLNGDGRPEIAVQFNEDFRTDIVVLTNNGDGTFSQRPADYHSLTGIMGSVVSGDLNADRAPDLLLTFPETGKLSVLLGAGDGWFAIPRVLPGTGTPAALAAADYNRDGLLDFAAVHSDANDVSIYAGRGDLTFEVQRSYRAGVTPVGLVAGDFTGDDKPDLAVANGGTRDISLLVNSSGEQADLGVQVEGLPTASVGRPISYTLTMTNSGANLAHHSELVLSLAGPVAIDALPAGCSAADQVIVCNARQLAAGSDLTYELQVTPTAAGVISASARVSSPTNDPNLTNNGPVKLSTSVLTHVQLPLIVR